MHFNDAAIVSVKVNDYRILFCYLSKDKKKRNMKHKHLLLHVKMVKKF